MLNLNQKENTNTEIAINALNHPIFLNPLNKNKDDYQIYYYHWEDKDKTSCVERFNDAEGQKKFFVHHYDKEQQKWNKGFAKDKDSQRPLYNLKEILSNKEERIIIVEGEKTAEAVKDFGSLATTCPFGSNGVEKTDLSCLYGRDILIIADLDEAGKGYEGKLLKKLANKANVKTLDIGDFFTKHKIENGQVIKCERELKKGYDFADVAAEGWTIQLLKQHGFSFEGNIPQEKKKDKAKLSETLASKDFLSSFFVEDEHLYYQKDKEKILIGGKIEVLYKTYFHERGEKIQGSVIAFFDDSGFKKRFQYKKSDMLLPANAFLRTLIDKGWMCGSYGNPTANVLLFNYLAKVQPCIDTQYHIVEQMGWQNVENEKVYVLNSEEVYSISKILTIKYGLKNEDYLTENKGGLKDWQDKILKYTIGNPYLIFTTCVAFCPPLLELAGLQGVCFNLCGESSKGKTTALHIASSIWGCDLSTFSTTANGLEGFLRTCNDALCILDELSIADAQQVKKIPYLIGNGIGKRRATKDGTTRDPITFRTVVLASGEMGLKGKLDEAKETTTAGSQVRFIDIIVDRHEHGILQELHDFENSKLLIEHLDKYSAKTSSDAIRGVAIREFLMHLTDNYNNCYKVKEVIKKYEIIILQRIEKDLRTTDLSKQILRVVRLFSLVATSGVLAVKAGVINFTDNQNNDAKSLVDAVAQVAIWYVESKGNVKVSSEVQDVIDTIQDVVESKQGNFIDAQDQQARIPNETYGFKETQNGEVIFYIYESKFNSLIRSRHYAVKTLIEKGIVEHNNENLERYSSTHQYRITKRFNGGVKKVIKINSNAFNSDTTTYKNEAVEDEGGEYV